jgi:NADH dehydrogenase
MAPSGLDGHPRSAHRVVVVGGGFGGLTAVRELRRAPVEITLIDRRNFHLFQPLLYQVATGVLAAGEIAEPLRTVFERDRNVRVVLGDVVGFDLADRCVVVGGLPGENGAERRIAYDSLIVAAGSSYAYFGHDEWRAHAPDIKSPESALDVRRRLLTAFEAAEVEDDPERRAAWLTFAVVGAGPTGVELAGQIADLARWKLRGAFRSIDTSAVRILLLETADRILPGFPPRLSAQATAALQELGVTTLPAHMVVDIDADSIVMAAPDGARIRVPTRTVVWAAGVVASGLSTALAAESGADLDRGGRVPVGPQLTVPGHPDVFAIGDMAQVRDAQGRPVPLPGLAPVAMQQGRHAAQVICGRLSGTELGPFRYRDKGQLATIGRGRAVAAVGRLQLSGPVAWLTWLLVHIYYLIGAHNRLIVLIRWMFGLTTRAGDARLIIGVPTPPGRPTHSIEGDDVLRTTTLGVPRRS